jgi:hypothetical protein
MSIVIKDRNYYICRTKRQYKWFWAHWCKYTKWDNVRLYVYRCRWCGEYHVSKQSRKLIVKMLIWLGTRYPRQYV